MGLGNWKFPAQVKTRLVKNSCKIAGRKQSLHDITQN
jgi:hypothetical protein